MDCADAVYCFNSSLGNDGVNIPVVWVNLSDGEATQRAAPLAGVASDDRGHEHGRLLLGLVVRSVTWRPAGLARRFLLQPRSAWCG